MFTSKTNINKIKELFELKGLPLCFGIIAPVAVLESKALVIVFAILFVFLIGNIYQSVKSSASVLFRPNYLAILFIIFSIWVFLSLFWTIDFNASGIKLIKLTIISLMGAGLFIGLDGLSPDSCRRIINAMVFGVIGGIVLLVCRYAFVLIQEGTGEAQLSFLVLSRLNPGLTVITILLWPAAVNLFLEMRWRSLGVLLVFYVGVLAVSTSGASALALVAGGISFLAAMWRRKLTGYALALLIFSFVVTTPFIVPKLTTDTRWVEKTSILPTSAQHRLYIWEFAANKALHRPLIGWGLDSSRSIPGGLDKPPVGLNNIPLHPHNAALQIWLELGAPGALIAALALATLILKIVLRPDQRAFSISAATIASLCSFLCVAFTAYSVWQSWWVVTAWMVAGTLFVFSKFEKKCDKPP